MPKWKGKQNQLRVYGILCAWSIAVLVTIRIEVVCSVYFYVIAVQPLAVAAIVCELRHYIFKYLDISFITKFETGETSPFHLCAQGELLRDANSNRSRGAIPFDPFISQSCCRCFQMMYHLRRFIYYFCWNHSNGMRLLILDSLD